MNAEQLSQRLERVATFVPKGARLADIGSDHAYLPINLVKRQRIAYAIAGEVSEGPYSSAQREVHAQALTAQIDVRLGDGLEVLTDGDNIDTITIAGMGGGLIRDILQRGFQKHKLKNSPRLILQPNIGERHVRQWLAAHAYLIKAEEILEEKQHLYEIIVAEKVASPIAMTESESLFGYYVEESNPTIFHKKWQQQLNKLENILAQMNQNTTQENIRPVKHQYELIQERLSQRKI